MAPGLCERSRSSTSVTTTPGRPPAEPPVGAAQTTPIAPLTCMTAHRPGGRAGVQPAERQTPAASASKWRGRWRSNCIDGGGRFKPRCTRRMMSNRRDTSFYDGRSDSPSSSASYAGRAARATIRLPGQRQHLGSALEQLAPRFTKAIGALHEALPRCERRQLRLAARRGSQPPRVDQDPRAARSIHRGLPGADRRPRAPTRRGRIRGRRFDQRLHV